MKRNQLLIEAVSEERRCPVCTSTNTLAVFNGTDTDGGQKIDNAGCGCLDCDASWQERFYRRENRTEVFNVCAKGVTLRPKSAQASEEAMPRRCPRCQSFDVLAAAKGTITRRQQRVSEANCRCQKCEASWLERWFHEDKYTRIYNVSTPNG